MHVSLKKPATVTLMGLFLFCMPFIASAQEYSYRKVEGDPLNTRIYTLENGLKVYLSVYENEPRMHTSIAVKAGGKHDPADNTGLAHYLEHLMFKGTDRFGSLDYEKEKMYLDQIEELFESYRLLTDEEERRAKYRIIDSISYEASKWAIPNEYDRMLSVIGARGTNAYTSMEQTVYINDIPANQIDRWLNIEAERFRYPVFRLFHTELETVYEEKNMSLDNDGRKAYDRFFELLYPHHTYGTQSILGSQDHLKNPSIKTIREYYNQYYVPNNMAVIISGDFDPDEMIVKIAEKFSYMQAADVPEFSFGEDSDFTEPREAELFGPDAEFLRMGWKLPGINTPENDIAVILGVLLSNGTAGVLDLNLNQAQKVLRSGGFVYSKIDYSTLQLVGNPKSGQTLEEVRDLLLGEIEKIKQGEFPDWLLAAAINDLKLREIRSMESNPARTRAMVNAFTNEVPWENYITRFERYEQITKEDIVAFANEYLGDNYAVVFKREGTDDSLIKMDKPHITPVVMNRDEKSAFFAGIEAMPIEPISPVFLNYKEDIAELELDGRIPVYYNENTENETFTLYYLLDMGNNHNRKLGMALDYLNYLGTDRFSPEEIKQMFYRMGMRFNVFNSNEQVYVYFNGLSEYFEEGIEFFEHLLHSAQANEQALENMKRDILRQRENRKRNKNYILRTAMYDYAIYGEESPLKNILSEEELMSVTSEELLDIIHNLTSYEHRILYYGNHTPEELISMLEASHRLPDELKPLPQEMAFTEKEQEESLVYVVDYDMTQVDLMMLSKTTDYQENKVPAINLFNAYFGAGMSSIVFQELREAKGLAYSAFAFYTTPNRTDRSHFVYSFIGTQSDKMDDAMSAKVDLLNNMPLSENSFNVAKESIMERINTERVTRTSVLFSYETARRMGREHDIREQIYNAVPQKSFDDLQAFQQKYVKDRTYTVLVIGKKDELDMEALSKYGKIKVLSLEDVFGY